MRAALIALVVGLTSTIAAAEAPKLPELGTVEGKRARIVVRGELTAKKREELVKLVGSVVADVERRFTRDAKRPDATVTLLLFGEPARYREVAATLGPVISDWGFYLPDQRTAIANVGASVGNLRHELVHPLIGDDFPAIPMWLNEGIASLYGSAKPGKRGFQFLVNYRLRDLQRALKDGTCPTLAELARSTHVEVHGDRAGVWYALSRYVLLYADRRGELPALYAELRAADVAKHGEILAKHIDEKAFRAWAKTLKR